MIITKLLIDRFTEKYEVVKSGCWLWTASTAGKGYGQIKLPGTRRQIYAHQLAYLYFKGEIPEGSMVCHICDIPRCVNPEHLFLGTARVNLQDMKTKGRHLYGGKNTQAKLTESKVLEMHRLHEGGMSTAKIAKRFDISQMTAWRIVNGERWEHIYRQRRRK